MYKQYVESDNKHPGDESIRSLSISGRKNVPLVQQIMVIASVHNDNNRQVSISISCIRILNTHRVFHWITIKRPGC